MMPETNKVISLQITWYVAPFKKFPFLEPKPNTNNHPYAVRHTLLVKRRYPPDGRHRWYPPG